ncbi:putative 20S rRNA accumulation protein 4 [Teratosphaeria destructans]|uniref:20S rRNA accumulation protein 4 n=1 Tax=Teratosphaeria destructans TaxID=418781 RepID=A0A9W7SWS6_9PEZI|nr:putative 20S rRNA accumulation protein 4 [Teratosphaeria destructans]
MADYDSDSSGADDVATNVLLGYASREPTGDDFSQLGGLPVWLDSETAPPGSLAKCKVCNGLMSLLLQLNGDIPDRFPGHERRLYIWSCRRKACRRKEGSVRGFRATRVDSARASTAPSNGHTGTAAPIRIDPEPAPNLGNTLFGVKSSSSNTANPFVVPSSAAATASANPFASGSSLAAKPAQKPITQDSLPDTFAQKARISSEPPTQPIQPQAGPHEPWPGTSAFPDPYPRYYVDADNEYLDSDPHEVPSNARLDNAANGESSSSIDDKAAFESSMDKTFQRFADRLSQNPEQVLRYEYNGEPLLYSKSGPVGKLLAPALDNANAKVQTLARAGTDSLSARLPKCTNCGSRRVFELQLTRMRSPSSKLKK